MIMQDRTQERMSRIDNIIIQAGRDNDTIDVCVRLCNQGGEAWKDFMDSPVGGFIRMAGPKENLYESITIDGLVYTPYPVPFSLRNYLRCEFKDRCGEYGVTVNIHL